MEPLRMLSKVQDPTTLAAVLSRDATGASAPTDLQAYDGTLLLELNAGAATAGTDPTLNVRLQHGDTAGGSFEDVAGAAFDEVTDAAADQIIKLDANELKRYVKLIWTIGGTESPAFPFGCRVLGLHGYE